MYEKEDGSLNEEILNALFTSWETRRYVEAIVSETTHIPLEKISGKLQVLHHTASSVIVQKD